MVILATMLLCTDASRCAIAQVRAASQSQREYQVRAFLIGLVQSRGFRAAEARYEDAFIDLNDDGIDEVVVYLMSAGDWCGTGGCTTLVLKRAGNTYVLVGQIPATRPPIRALREKSKGWRILTTWVSGATFKAFEEEHLFNGKRYSISGRRVAGAPKGDIIISGNVTDEKPLSERR